MVTLDRSRFSVYPRAMLTRFDLATPAAHAVRTGLTMRTIRRQLKAGKLKHYRVELPSGRTRIFIPATPFHSVTP
jgi:hypothetical protein